ncbi:MAG: hypothetical protein GY714_11030 [Desulfobacterales bacterium]|nr:hypothetical protein [Desulfobacterales bacterium]MCP4161292.1 hypothetical protein [Deltaproteobacteria bacterium]
MNRKVTSHLITSIKVQKKNKNRVSIFINEKYSFSIDAISAMKIKTGMEITDEIIADLQREDLPRKAYSEGLYYLSFRSRTYSEADKHLKDKGYDDSIVEEALKKLIDINFIDDENYARQFLESKIRVNPKGALSIKYELKQKGISEDIIEKALLDYDEYEAAFSLIKKKYYKWEKLPIDKVKNKIYTFLSSRGFTYDITKDVTETIVSNSS